MSLTYLPLVLFLAGALSFARFFQLAARLTNERIGPPPSKLEKWIPWLPGSFTPAGQQLRRRMNVLLVVGWILLVAGMLLSGP